jgi:hypothetical protein
MLHDDPALRAGVRQNGRAPTTTTTLRVRELQRNYLPFSARACFAGICYVCAAIFHP